MSNITVHFTDGTKKHYPETSRAGGSFCTKYKVTEGWVIITDAYGTEILYPSEKIEHVEVINPLRY